MHIGAAGIQVKINIKEIQVGHPNTYQITLRNPWETHQVIAISTGGGMIEVIEIDGAKVSLAGDSFVTLIYTSAFQKVGDYLEKAELGEDLEIHSKDKTFITLKTQAFLDKAILEELQEIEGVTAIKQIKPVLPVLTRKNTVVPFITCDEMMAYNEDKNLSLWELAVRYESMRGNISEKEVLSKMNDIRIILKNAVETGLKGTQFEDRILGPQSVKFKSMMEEKKADQWRRPESDHHVCVCDHGGEEFYGSDRGSTYCRIVRGDARSGFGRSRFLGTFGRRNREGLDDCRFDRSVYCGAFDFCC